MSTVANLIDSKGRDVLTVPPGLPVREAVAEIKIKNLESYISGSM